MLHEERQAALQSTVDDLQLQLASVQHARSEAEAELVLASEGAGRAQQEALFDAEQREAKLRQELGQVQGELLEKMEAVEAHQGQLQEMRARVEEQTRLLLEREASLVTERQQGEDMRSRLQELGAQVEGQAARLVEKEQAITREMEAGDNLRRQLRELEAQVQEREQAAEERERDLHQQLDDVCGQLQEQAQAAELAAEAEQQLRVQVSQLQRKLSSGARDAMDVCASSTKPRGPVRTASPNGEAVGSAGSRRGKEGKVLILPHATQEHMNSVTHVDISPSLKHTTVFTNTHLPPFRHASLYAPAHHIPSTSVGHFKDCSLNISQNIMFCHRVGLRWQARLDLAAMSPRWAVDSQLLCAQLCPCLQRLQLLTSTC